MSESSVQYSRGYFRTQKITKIICISSQQHTIPKKVPLEQNLSNSVRGKWRGRKTRGKSREGRTNRCQRSTETRLSSFEILTFCYQFEISTKVVKQLGKRIELEKIRMPKTTLPIEKFNFCVRKTLSCWDREIKERKKTFCRDRFRTLTIVESTSTWLSLIFTSIEDPWLCTDWLSEIKLCKKTRVDGYQLAYAGLNGDDSQVCKAGKTKYSGFSKIWKSTYQTYREPSLENNIKTYEIIKTKINFGD